MAEPAPRPAPAALVAERIARHRDPLTRLRARGAGLLTHRPPVLELFYEPGDPHAHLCAQLLPTLATRARVPIVVTLVGQGSAAEYPEAERQRAYAALDASRIAPARGLSFPADAQLPGPGARRWAAEELSALCENPGRFGARESEVAGALFGGAGAAEARDPAAASATLDAGRARRERLGHFLPAVWQFDGDWFWGVDRIGYLEARLRSGGWLDGDEALIASEPEAAALAPVVDPLPPLEFFYSFRSPYSYLAATELLAFHEEWPAEVVVRPVLPMVMRGLPVPRAKRMYTVRDVAREADRRGIPFGRVCDPVGAGARRCLQAFEVAEGTRAQLEFIVSAATAIWSEGIDVSTDRGLRYACDRAGLAWSAVAQRLIADGEVPYAEANRRDLLDAGLWGVPCYRVGDFTAWGQDRFWMVRELLRRQSAHAVTRSQLDLAAEIEDDSALGRGA